MKYFDNVAPNEPKDISSWMYDHAPDEVEIIDTAPRRFHATILATRSLKIADDLDQIPQAASGRQHPVEFMRHYYDIYEPHRRPGIQKFIGTEAHKRHKTARFRQGDNQNIAENEAFVLRDAETRALYADAYDRSSALYFAGRPTFEQVMAEIGKWIDML